MKTNIDYKIILAVENIITILFGLIIGIIISYSFIQNIDYIGPDSNEIKKNTYTDTYGKKYKWDPQVCICPINYSMNLLYNPQNIIKIKH